MERYPIGALPGPLLLLCALLVACWPQPGAAGDLAGAVAAAADRTASPRVLAPLSAAACSLEPAPLGTGAVAVGDLLRYFSLIRAADCTSCTSPSDLAPLDLRFRFRFTQACSTLVRVFIVGTNGNATCPAPNQANILCPPVEYTLSAPGPESDVFDLPLAPDCCIRGEAFACLEFLAAGTCGSLSPNATFTTAPCTTCQQYVAIAGYPGTFDWCNAPTNSLWFAVNADCCALSPAEPGSWGRVKAIYR